MNLLAASDTRFAIERGNLFPYKNKHFFLFSKSGFTKGCAEKAKGLGNVTLIEYSEIMEEIRI